MPRTDTLRAACLLAALSLLAGHVAQACERGDLVIAIDPGHTRASPGATSARGVPEVRFNDNLARRVLDKLRRAGFSRAFLTNSRQASISLSERTQRANERNAQLFLSLHHDSAQAHLLSTWSFRGKRYNYTDDIKGYSLFVSELNGDAAGSLRFARSLGTQLRASGFTPTLHHAEKIAGENRELLDERLGIYRFDDLVVLKSASMPAVLFEAGLIVNRDEELLLRSANYQTRIALALTRAVVEYCAGPTSSNVRDARQR
jgi:N-acetylmuramoyl-L-alanine amidase